MSALTAWRGAGFWGKLRKKPEISARVRKPKDKPDAEGTVRNVSTWITAALRNEQFFSLAELNSAIREKLEQFNANTFQKKEGSRRSLFLGEEMPLLATLPATRFELSDWKVATVQFNYHIAVDKMYYSVPYQYIKNKLVERIEREADGEARERADVARSFLDVGEMTEEIWERFVKGACVYPDGLRFGGILGMKMNKG